MNRPASGIALVFAGLILIGRGGGARPAEGPDRPSSPGLPSLVPLPPGLVVGDRPPVGWDRLVIKAVPKLASGDLTSLPASAKGTATFFRTVLLADARKADRGGFVLDRIGMGLCVPRNAADVVVSPDADLGSIGVKLGTLDAIVLGQAGKQLARAHLIARSPGFAVLDAPSMLVRSGAHREGLVRYAFLADRADGSISTLVWSLAADPGQRGPVDSVALLAPSLVCESPVDVSATKLLGQIPITWSFALAGLPPGRAVPLPKPLALLASRDPQVAADVTALETGLRAAIEAGSPTLRAQPALRGGSRP